MPATSAGTSRSREGSHWPAQTEHDDVVDLVAVAMPAREHALAAEAHALERALRAAVAGVRPRGQPLHPERLEGEGGDQRLDSRLAPVPQ